ncbi:MAG: AIPR family protein [Termitinemataceae bacterium]|nr:MAG: AIPR family protein [Termitinemataceae bacterium]
MDRITKSLLDKFIGQNKLYINKENEAFEYFIGYITTSIHFQESFEISDVITGSGDDTGIDSLSILVNGSIITEPEELDDIAESSTYLDVDFIFTQSETSSNFDTQKIGQFCFGVKDIFQEVSKLKQNDEIKLKKSIIDKIYVNSSKFKKRKPNLFLYYATTGKWVDDKNLTARAIGEKTDIEALSLFEKVKFDFLDADKIQKLYMKVTTGVSQEIKIDKFSIFPKLENVDQSFTALLESNEFLKLLLNDDGSINQSIFYDNIRDWQELNPVNTEIAETLNSNSDQKYFHLLNNGITIVADAIRQTGNSFCLENYQIVNGCQTSYAIFNNKDKITDIITIPVKLISTTNQEIKNKIIKATNRQTPITDDMLYALSELPKKLETYFDSYPNEQKLYFERRAKQYSRDDSIDKTKIINLQNLVRAFASAFLRLPHQTTRNYKQLIKSNNKKIFSQDNVFEMYYLCSLLNYKIEMKIKSKFITLSYRPSKWHIIMCYLYLSEKTLPPFNSGKMSILCKSTIEEIFDVTKFENKINNIVEIIDKASGGNLQRDNIRTEIFTSKVLEAIENYKKHKEPHA